MNSLSWLLYLADVLPNLSTAAGAILFFGVIVLFATTVFHFGVKFNFGEVSDRETVPEEVKSLSSRIFVLSWTVWVLCLFIYVLTPSKETIYLIAGSEAGEYVVQTPEAKAIMDDVREVIQLQLEALKPKPPAVK